MLFRILASHGGDCEQCRLLGYKNIVRTSQETHYLSATESSQLMLCKFSAFHDGDYKNALLLRRVALVGTEVSKKISASIIKVTRIDKLVTTVAVTSNRSTVRRNAKH
jgi:hypothetical protein